MKSNTKKIFLLIVLLLIIIILPVLFNLKSITESFESQCGCPPVSKPIPVCNAGEFYCPLDNKCHPYCGNTVDSNGVFYPCDQTAQLPHDPNISIQLKDNATGVVTYANNVLVPEKDFTTAQLNYDLGRTTIGAMPPKSDEERARLRLFNQPSCRLVATKNQASYTPYTQKYSIIQLAADTVDFYSGDLTAGTPSYIETRHNYRDNEITNGVLRFPGAIKLLLEWDSRTSTEAGYDYFYLWTSENMDSASQVGVWSGDISNFKNIYVDSNVLSWKFRTDGSVTRWGIKLKITPYFPKTTQSKVQPLLVTSTFGLNRGNSIRIGTENSYVVDLKTNIIYVPTLSKKHFKGETISKL